MRLCERFSTFKFKHHNLPAHSIRYAFLIPLVALVSCGSGGNRSSLQSDTTMTRIAAQQKVDSSGYKLQSYQEYINTLDTTDAGTLTLAANKYRALFTTNDTILNDKAYTIFERYYTKLMFGINDFVFRDTVNITIFDTLDLSEEKNYPPSRYDLCVKLKENGFRIIHVEGSPQLGEDRAVLEKWFYGSVSSVMKKYLEEVKKETDEGFEDDGGLLITPVQLADRTIWWEQFAATYQHFIFSAEARHQHQIYFTYLLHGMDNTPVMDYETKSLDAGFRDAYDHLLTKYASEKTTQLVKPYFEALKKKNIPEADKLLEDYKAQSLLLW